MRYWWVNQNQTYAHEVGGGYLWSPKTRTDGGRNQFYDNMREVRPGDLIFSFCDTYIKAIGIATGSATTAPKPPEFGGTGENWGANGWLVPVSYTELGRPLHPKSHIGILLPLLPAKYSPLRPDGNGNQGVYLAEVPAGMAQAMIGLLDRQVERILSERGGSVDAVDRLDDEAQKAIGTRTDIPETTKAQLVLARRGQGLFRGRVAQIERGCRVTGVNDPDHLRASHIKPWRHSTDAEKLDGNNGLLLAPHVDHLFDRGYISFKRDGQMLVSPSVKPEVLERWSIDPRRNVGPFLDEQERFLAWHREQEFRN